MKRTGRGFAIVVAGTLLLLGCGGDIGKMIDTSPELQAKVIEAIGGNATLASRMTDRLLGADSTRAMLIGKLLDNGVASQEIMARIAREPTMVDGIINLAVQDTSMRDHVITLLRGMQMVGGAPR